MALAVDNGGNVFVAGTTGSGQYENYVTIKYSSSLRPYLTVQEVGHHLVLNWTNSTVILQTSPDITGPFTNIPSATSPYTNALTHPQQYFRLASP